MVVVKRIIIPKNKFLGSQLGSQEFQILSYLCDTKFKSPLNIII